MPIPLLGALLIGLLVGSLITVLLSGKKVTVTEESNCNDSFLKFTENLTFPNTKEKLLLSARSSIKTELEEYFRNKPGISIPRYYIQGSYKMKTVVRPQDDSCDVDLGVYFSSKPAITPLALYQNIERALKGLTKGKIVLKRKCVRIEYAADFHIDLPVYYFDKNENQYYLAVKDGDWEISDPKEFRVWFTNQTKGKEQIIRLIRYFKSWADNYKTNTGRKMPSGLAFTIWCIQFYQAHEREDVSFLQTADKIKQYLDMTPVSAWECKMPTAPLDNVLTRLNNDRRGNFRTALKELITQGTEALSAEETQAAVNTWKAVFGRWFPEKQG